MSIGTTGTKKLTAMASLLIAGSLLLAACGPEATPTTITNPAPGGGATSTAAVGVTAEPTTSSDSPLVNTPGTSETSTPVPGAVTEGNSIKITMNAQNGSNQSGSATLTDMGNGMVEVVLDITDPGTADPQPAHIHQGTCATLDPQPAYPLSNVVNGKSVTDVEATLDSLTAAPYALNVHKSAAEAQTYVSCGEIKFGSSTGDTPQGQTSPTAPNS